MPRLSSAVLTAAAVLARAPGVTLEPQIAKAIGRTDLIARPQPTATARPENPE